MILDNSNLSRIYKAALQLFAERGSTHITVSDLADRAGVARGTVYNNVKSIDTLFEEVAVQLTNEMSAVVYEQIKDIEDPALKLAQGIKAYIKRGHEDPDWARFLARFGISSSTLNALWSEHLAEDIQDGIEQKRYTVAPEQLLTISTLVGGSVLASIYAVREGTQTWKDTTRHLVELILRSLGLNAEEASAIAEQSLD